jgi:uncharacterized LabA/DUF88 family protein
MPRSIILIDGSNFYFKLKDLGLQDLISFDFAGFVKSLAKDTQLVEACYFIGVIKTDNTEKTQKLFNNQRRLLSKLKLQGLKYSLGYLLKSDGRFHEKGVDVNIAVNILTVTYENLVDKIIVVSSDTDLLPAIQKAKEKGKIVEYVGFAHKPSIAMIKNCSLARLLRKEDLV